MPQQPTRSEESSSREAHSARMKRVRRRDTAAELRLRKALWADGLRYRKQVRVLGTTPDICFVRSRVAVFVDGCFWHGCPRHYRAPVSNAQFWSERLSSNQTRDARDTLRLQLAGWTVVRVWECELRESVSAVVDRVRGALTR